MTRYIKHADAHMDEIFSGAEWFGNIRLGENFLFHRKILTWRYISLDRVVRAWRRVEECTGKTGCCSNDFSIHYLLIETSDGETISLKIGEALYRHEPEALIEKLREAYPKIVIGKP